MAAEVATAGLTGLEKELICFICTEVLYQPLTLIDCLHTFCGSCLKEWFSHQYKKALQPGSPTTTNPYTCPTCRATVKDARHNATVTTLLDMFLVANPTRGKTAEEREERAESYKPGEDILPRCEQPRRSHRRSRRAEEEAELRDRRMMEQAREQSLRDFQSTERSEGRLAVPNGNRGSSTSREREDRRARRREHSGHDRRRRQEASDGANSSQVSRENTPELPPRPSETPSLPATSSPRHPDAVEARQRDRAVAHQASLRSLVSASESGSGTGTGDSLNEARIMQEIIAEGLLEGINVDELNDQEQDELSERIAEAYRQRHRNRSSVQSATDSTVAQVAPVDRSSPRQDSSSLAIRSRARAQSVTASDTDRPTEPSILSHPPTSRLRQLEAAETMVGALRPSEHRRRASDQNRRQTSPAARSSNRSSSGEAVHNAVARSGTDLTNTTSTGAAQPAQLSETRRHQTEPQHAVQVSDVWRVGGRDAIPSRTAEPVPEASPAIPTTTAEPSSVFSTPAISRETALAPVEMPARSTTPRSSPPAQPLLQAVSSVKEPQINCSRCSRPNIQYDVHKHCTPCNMDLCLRCYREGRGCHHWFGFGHAAIQKFEASQPTGSRGQFMELPHALVSRRYLPPTNGSDKSNPAERLLEGQFCDRCHAFANSLFWSCDYCNEGEWGFCNSCTNTHHCCVHPLIPVAHKDFTPRSPRTPSRTTFEAHTIPHVADHRQQSTSSSVPAKSVETDYIPLTIATKCDICRQPIQPIEARFHCPFHPSPTPVDAANTGDYDICTPCYHTLVKQGRIKRDDGPSGWRKCPDGHRMIVVAFEIDHLENQRRIVLNDLVGGHKLTEEDMRVWQNAARTDPTHTLSTVGGSSGNWIWREDHSTQRRTRARNTTLTSAIQNNKFPPDGGFGSAVVGLWSYYPAEGEAGRGELLFPKGAEVREVEEINDEWGYGVYMGEKGLFHLGFVRAISG